MNNSYTGVIPIPPKTSCGGIPTFVWPRRMDDESPNCFCLPIEVDTYSFKRCAQNCRTEFEVEMRDGDIVFRNLDDFSGTFLAHFLCDENPCAGSCFMESFMSSYTIISSKLV
jgi:hypothetical protein